jgi:hypothetical protein
VEAADDGIVEAGAKIDEAEGCEEIAAIPLLGGVIGAAGRGAGWVFHLAEGCIVDILPKKRAALIGAVRVPRPSSKGNVQLPVGPWRVALTPGSGIRRVSTLFAPSMRCLMKAPKYLPCAGRLAA